MHLMVSITHITSLPHRREGFSLLPAILASVSHLALFPP